MSKDRTIIDPARLWGAVRQQSASALASADLRPIATEQRMVEDDGVRFVVRMVSGEWEKDRASDAGAGMSAERRRKNPFLPPDESLRVADLSATHVAVLNKFPVFDDHLLLVTRSFEHQETALTLADLEALALALAATDGLGFHNGGSVAGASQPHKHLQLVPLPLAAEGPAIPIAPLLADAGERRVPGLPFRHAFLRLERTALAEPNDLALAMHAGYRAMLGDLGLGDLGLGAGGEGAARLPPYNLLVTRCWMLLVPRSRESADGVSVNGLGFAGALLVRDVAQMDAVTRLGPMSMLRQVAFDPC